MNNAHIPQVSDSVDKLAKVINEKNKILDLLKKEYERKLHEVEYYSAVLKAQMQSHGKELEPSYGTQVDGQSTRTDLFEISRCLESQKCQSCDLEIWNISHIDKFPYLLIPKVERIPPLVKDESGLELANQLETRLKLTPSNSPPLLNGGVLQQSPNPTNPRYLKKMSKKTCSYCNSTGHSRAKCPIRLCNG
ncbi:hypothetical protein BABINDRAFT_158982 [Babjeviella inositovora NRRL Y-12698]|uniref:CCHC-type domain-containing protein n=1 Tax=Babjeviella inositovora NRRL Y-12698 TaxID=984486 RepID=A0A1E3QXV2_9ASCO|nr:uncharacterized protein BABINDRAFT_158982 [Babjeviella inositovora NRRL Y-12698]ODQ82374.1 hypothetical protein BABINDRAFT_158982 [Babjeviella inositovora NRRL Y-12698]